MRHIWVAAKAWALGARCRVVGHNYDTHFTNLVRNMTAEDGEIPWCDRCGREQGK